MWMDKKVEGWAVLVRNLSGVDNLHPQTVYDVMHK